MADSITCPDCQKVNPATAKFCAGCAKRLSGEAAPNPTPPPPPPPGAGAGGQGVPPGPNPVPPPPPRPGPNAMMSSMGGKTESRQFEGSADSLYAAALEFAQNDPGADIKHQAPGQQISVALIFKDFLTTLNAPVKIDTDIMVVPTTPTQCNVSVRCKVDWNSTIAIWMLTFAMVVFGVLFVWMIPWMIWLMVGIGGSVLTIWMMNTRGPAQVTERLFNYLRNHQPSASPQPEQPATPPPVTPEAPSPEPEATPAPEPVAPSSENPDAEVEPMARIKQLAELKEMGAITAEEFEAKKKDLLDRI